jgi:hypothetical protein
MFPEFFSSPGHHGLPFFDFTWNTLPKASEEYGKLFVWTFIAGFAERLVPDSIDRLTDKFSQTNQAPTGKIPPKSSTTAPPPTEPDPTQADQAPKAPITKETLQDVLHSGQLPADEPQAGSSKND